MTLNIYFCIPLLTWKSHGKEITSDVLSDCILSRSLAAHAYRATHLVVFYSKARGYDYRFIDFNQSGYSY